MATQLWAAALVIVATLIGSVGPILLKKGAGRFSLNFFSQFKNRALIGGVFFYVISSLIFIPALRGGELSVLYPLVSVSYIWVSLLSVKFLNEKMGALKWVGILCIIIGVSMIGLGS
ncbi:MAG: multidrug transporter [Candidatus Aenigmarchaeota archaeon]|nr:multidrug transporter [Candidatus Aenigmarchaeota archaeon]